MKYLIAAAISALALCGAPAAHADPTDDAFFKVLLKEGITVGDQQAALNNVVKICGQVMIGESPDTLAAAIDAAEPGLGYNASKIFVLTAMQFYCQPPAMKKVT